VTIISLQVGDC